MVVLKGPSLSVQARGSIGNTLIFSNWKGRSTLKFSPKVSNPKTAPQVGRRAMLRFLATSFASLSAADIATWLPLALNGEISTYNAWVAFNMNRWGQFLYPTKAYPPSDTLGSGEITGFSLATRNRTFKIRIDQGEMNANWGYHLHRSTSSGFTPSLDNVIRIGFWDWHQNDTIYYVDGPLQPGTYYYEVNTFSESGYAEGLFVPPLTGTIP